jgi:hypothetical protein
MHDLVFIGLQNYEFRVLKIRGDPILRNSFNFVWNFLTIPLSMDYERPRQGVWNGGWQYLSPQRGLLICGGKIVDLIRV